MKCIALLTSFVVAALAEPEPFFGHVGYAGIGLPVSRYANAYGLNTRTYISSAPVVARPHVARRTYIASAPVVTRAHVSRVIPSVTAPVPAVSPAVPAASPYRSTATLKAVPAAPSTLQFHKQDEFGNFEYGYDNVNSAKKEIGNAQVGVTGSYTVKDLQGSRTVNYVADAYGFRATPAGFQGRKKREAEAEAFYPYRGIFRSYPRIYNNAVASPLAYSIATPASFAVPAVTPNAVPVSTSVVKSVAAAPSASQFHAQDEFGNYEYGYQNPNSAKREGGNARTGVTGAYSYRDAYGIERSFSYVADSLGFRMSPTLLRHKRQAVIAPSDPIATRPATKMIIHYNPGFSSGYRVYH